MPDKTFDLDVHLRRMRLPDHGGLRAVLDLAQTMATTGFDPALPLWEAMLVEGMDVNAALVMKVHHSVIDGVGGLTVLAHLFDTPGAGRRGPRPEEGTGRGAGQGLAAGAVGGSARRGPARGRRDGRVVAPVPIVRPAGRAGHVGGQAHGPGRQADLSDHDRTELPAPRRCLDLDLQTVKQAAETWGGTINDVFVVSVMRGLALYHEQHGVVSPGFRALMPVNVRTQSDPTWGNDFVPARFVIPAHADVADCVAEVRRVAEEWKSAPGLAMSDVLATGLSVLPSVVALVVYGVRCCWATTSASPTSRAPPSPSPWLVQR